MKGSVAFAVLLSAVLVQVHGAEWIEDGPSEVLTLRSQECTIYTVPFKENGTSLVEDIRVKIDASKFSETEECKQADLMIASSFSFEGDCFERSENDTSTCAVPGASGVFSKQDVCDHLDKLNMTSFEPDEVDGDTQTIDGAVCFSGTNYFLAFQSNCTNTSTIEVELERRPLSDANKEKCKNEACFSILCQLMSSGLGAALIAVIVISSILFCCCIVGIPVCICCFGAAACGAAICACVTCGRRKKQQTVVIQPPSAPIAGTPIATTPVTPLLAEPKV